MPTMPPPLDRSPAVIARRLPVRDANLKALRRHQRQHRAAQRGHDFIAQAAAAGDVSPRSATVALRWLPTASPACQLALLDRLTSYLPSSSSHDDVEQLALDLLARWRGGLSSRAHLVRDAGLLARRLVASTAPKLTLSAKISALHALLLTRRLGSKADSSRLAFLGQLTERLLDSLVDGLEDGTAARLPNEDIVLAYASDLWRDNAPRASNLKPVLELMFHHRCCRDEMNVSGWSATKLAAVTISSDNLRSEAAFSAPTAKSSLIAMQSLDGSWLPPVTPASPTFNDPIAVTALVIRALSGAPRSGPLPAPGKPD